MPEAPTTSARSPAEPRPPRASRAARRLLGAACVLVLAVLVALRELSPAPVGTPLPSPSVIPAKAGIQADLAPPANPAPPSPSVFPAQPAPQADREPPPERAQPAPADDSPPDALLGTLTGYVLDEAGRPVAGVTVTASVADDPAVPAPNEPPHAPPLDADEVRDSLDAEFDALQDSREGADPAPAPVLTLRDAALASGARDEAVALTGPDGAFRLTGLVPDQVYEVAGTHPHYDVRPTEATWPMPDGPPFELRAHGVFPVKITVVAEYGEPPDWRLEVCVQGDAQTAHMHAEVGADAKPLRLRPGAYRLETMEGYCRGAVAFEVRGPAAVSLTVRCLPTLIVEVESEPSSDDARDFAGVAGEVVPPDTPEATLVGGGLALGESWLVRVTTRSLYHQGRLLRDGADEADWSGEPIRVAVGLGDDRAIPPERLRFTVAEVRGLTRVRVPVTTPTEAGLLGIIGLDPAGEPVDPAQLEIHVAGERCGVTPLGSTAYVEPEPDARAVLLGEAPGEVSVAVVASPRGLRGHVVLGSGAWDGRSPLAVPMAATCTLTVRLTGRVPEWQLSLTVKSAGRGESYDATSGLLEAPYLLPGPVTLELRTYDVLVEHWTVTLPPEGLTLEHELPPLYHVTVAHSTPDGYSAVLLALAPEVHPYDAVIPLALDRFDDQKHTSQAGVPPGRYVLVVAEDGRFGRAMALEVHGDMEVRFAPTRMRGYRVGGCDRAHPVMSPLHAGLQDGDLLLAIDGARIADFGDLGAFLTARPRVWGVDAEPDATVSLLVERNGELRTIVAPSRTFFVNGWLDRELFPIPEGW